MANQLAVNSPDVSAAVPYYGRQPASEDVPKIKASLLLHYAGLDEGINKGIPEYEAALKKASIDYKLYMYEGAQHAFNNDTNTARYNKEAAELAWKRTIAFFKEKLKTLDVHGRRHFHAAFLVFPAAAAGARIVAACFDAGFGRLIRGLATVCPPDAAAATGPPTLQRRGGSG